MLTITIPKTDYYDEVNEEFITVEEITLDLEHSLFSLSKWESSFEKPFLGKETKTTEETYAYIKAMTVSGDFPPEVYRRLSADNLSKINKYIDSKMSATWFNDQGKSKKRNTEIITSEIVYYWMVTLAIPFECQHWHLNRLLTLVRVINEKNKPADKRGNVSKSEMMAQRRALNEERRAQFNTTG